MVQIRFIAQGSNSLIGGFTSGDLARVGPELARHLVEEAKVAQYVTAEAPRREAQASPQPETRRRASKTAAKD